MPFIIPNATDTTGGNRYASLDQAEPDSLDFEILGNDSSGVIQGLVATELSTPGSSVAVTSGTIVLNGLVYPVNAATVGFSTSPSNVRFDLVIARKDNTGTMNLIGVPGTNSQYNPTFPVSLSRVAGATPENYFDPSTDVVIAAVYRIGSTNILNKHIVDKARRINTAIPYRASTAPTASDGAVGDLYIQTGSIPSGGSGLYVKRNTTTWTQLAPAFVDPGVPIGSVITWVSPVTPPNPAVWLLCNGASKTEAEFGQLFNVIQRTYGGDVSTGTFNLPDFTNMYLAGSPGAASAYSPASPVGNINHAVTLQPSDIASHTHTLNHGHSGTTSSAGTHNHTPQLLSGNTSTQDFAIRKRDYAPGRYVSPYDKTGTGYANQYQYSTGDFNPNDIPNSTDLPGMSIDFATVTSDAGVHTHTVTVPSSSFTTGENTRSTNVDVRPRTMLVQYYIRYA